MSDGALQAASLGSLRMAPFSAPFGSFGQTAIHLPRLAEPGRRRGNLAGEPVGRVQGSTLPIRVAMACCQIIALPVRLHLPSICLRADNRGAEGSIRFSQALHPPDPARCAPCDPSALFADSAGQMQRVPVYRMTFASIPYGRVRPGDDELSVHPATKFLADASRVSKTVSLGTRDAARSGIGR
ncbi:hypothetical protein J2Z84_004506 [Agrobacterium rubi]|nr:hypothetical protein [Agrobacterium rubi]